MTTFCAGWSRRSSVAPGDATRDGVTSPRARAPVAARVRARFALRTVAFSRGKPSARQGLTGKLFRRLLKGDASETAAKLSDPAPLTRAERDSVVRLQMSGASSRYCVARMQQALAIGFATPRRGQKQIGAQINRRPLGEPLTDPPSGGRW